jgi:ectoine hydroxylase-related dioxygenase (phytanoyl-CoA dioxygenase family)
MTTDTTAQRLTRQQVESFNTEGYLIVTEPIFPEAKFRRLVEHFDRKLEALPPGIRPEAMDVPHFTDPDLFEWLFADEVLDLIEPIIGPDIALWASHFLCKPRGNGRRVPWHEDSYYWKGMLEPMQVVTVWLAIDPSTPENGCMYVIPRTHGHGFSDYDPVDPESNVFPTEITPAQRDETRAVPCVLKPNQASVHDARLMHGSPPNNSSLRRCGYTMRYMPTSVKFTQGKSAMGHSHQIYLARGRDLAGNIYADPTKSYPELARYREQHVKHSH